MCRVPNGSFRFFSNCHERTLGGRGSRMIVRFLKMSFVGHCNFEKGSQNKHF